MTKPIFVDYPRDDESNTIKWAKCLVALINMNSTIKWGFQKNTSLQELCFYTLNEESDERRNQNRA